jgi:hypothetical protein
VAGPKGDDDPTAGAGTTTGTTDAPEPEGHVADLSSAENHTAENNNRDEER